MENAVDIHDPGFESSSIRARDDHSDSDGPATSTVHRLSPSQERKLVDYFEDHLLEITRNHKKRYALLHIPHPTAYHGAAHIPRPRCPPSLAT